MSPRCGWRGERRERQEEEDPHHRSGEPEETVKRRGPRDVSSRDGLQRTHKSVVLEGYVTPQRGEGGERRVEGEGG